MMDFFVLEERDRFSREAARSCFYSIVKPFNLAPCEEICPVCKAVCGPQVWLPPRRINASQSDCGDLILGVAFELVVSEKFREAYMAAGLNGLKDFASVEVEEIKDARYYAARPQITCTRLDELASGVAWEIEPVCSNCRLGALSKLERVVVDESTWDGSDVFMGTGLYGVKLVTERFVEVVRAANLTNFAFVPANEFSIP
jgi:hypothetical protein